MPARKELFPISPVILISDSLPGFSIYLKRGEDNFILYCEQGDLFSEAHSRRLGESGVREVYVPRKQQEAFARYQREHLDEVLEREEVPLEERSRAFYQVSTGIIEDLFATVPANGLQPEQLGRVSGLVQSCLGFLSRDSHLRQVVRLMAYDYETYSHCVHVFVFSLALLRRDGLAPKDLESVGVGAVLHDIGKTRVPREILQKPGKLSPEEFAEVRKHPAKGAAICMELELERATSNVVLYHHEKLDGSGYPAGIGGGEIPEYVQAVTISDIYDALTSQRPYADGLKPFDALRLMQEEFRGKISGSFFERLVRLLSFSWN
jgi:putative nucleotidyltransferase with HDIG domain